MSDDESNAADYWANASLEQSQTQARKDLDAVREAYKVLAGLDRASDEAAETVALIIAEHSIGMAESALLLETEGRIWANEPPGLGRSLEVCTRIAQLTSCRLALPRDCRAVLDRKP